MEVGGWVGGCDDMESCGYGSTDMDMNVYGCAMIGNNVAEGLGKEYSVGQPVRVGS